MRGLFIAFAVLATTLFGASLPDKESFHLYLLIGQSNMAGRGPLEDSPRPGSPRVLTLNESNEWVEAVDPIHFDKPGMEGVGLGPSFGDAMAAQNPKIVIGLIPCAAGGTSVSQWQKGAAPTAPWGVLYDNAVVRAKIAMDRGVLKGILWHQGEADCRQDKLEVYEGRITQLVLDLRKDLNAPKVPFVAGELGVWGRTSRQAFNINLEMLPSWIENSAVVSSEGLNHRRDKTHFDSASQRIFGQRYAKAMVRLQGVSAGMETAK